MSEQTNAEKRVERALSSGVAGYALIKANAAQQKDGQFHLPSSWTSVGSALLPVVGPVGAILAKAIGPASDGHSACGLTPMTTPNCSHRQRDEEWITRD